VGVGVGLSRFEWWSGGGSGSCCGIGGAAGGVGEGDPVGLFGVAFDPELREVVLTVTAAAQRAQIPQLGGSLVSSVDDVMEVEAAGVVAPRHPTLLVASQDEAADAVGDALDRRADAERPPLGDERWCDRAFAGQEPMTRPRSGSSSARRW